MSKHSVPAGEAAGQGTVLRRALLGHLKGNLRTTLPFPHMGRQDPGLFPVLTFFCLNFAEAPDVLSSQQRP